MSPASRGNQQRARSAARGAPLVLAIVAVCGLSLPARSVTAADATPPAPPRGIGAWGFDGEVSIGWADQFETDLAGYNLYRSTTPGGPYTKINAALLTEPMYRDTGRTNGAPVYYVVHARDTSSNESADSEEAAATPAADVYGTRDGRKGLGKGFFVHPPHNDWHYTWPSSIKNDPDIAGFEMMYTWADLEPEQGRYDWSPIDNYVIPQAASCNKKWTFKFVAVTGKLKEGESYPPETVWTNDGTPAWFFDLPEVKPVGGFASAEGHLPFYPLFWDPTYFRHLDEFLAAMAKRYDGLPSLEYVRIGGWSIETNEPSFYSGALSDITLQLQNYGMTGLSGTDKNDNFPNYTVYARGLRELQNLWFKNFKQTRITCTIHMLKGPNSHEEVMNNNMVIHRGTLVNTGLNEGDHSDTRILYRSWHDDWGAKTGWGDITHLGDHGGPAPGKSLALTAMYQGLGSDEPGDEDFAPASKSSYFATADDFADNHDATSWAQAHYAQ